MASTTPSVRVVWDDRFTQYDFGQSHPMNPVRLDLTTRLARSLGLFDLPNVEVTPVADEPDVEGFLHTVHTPAFVAAVKAASEDPDHADAAFGLGTEDDPAFVGIHQTSARIAVATRDLCRDVWTGEVDHGVNYCGGMHHAMADRAAGFCIYNDAALGIKWLLDNGAERVAYVDVDVHHGDGVERIFWDDPRVLTISVHETGRVLFPGSGFPGDVGGPQAQGMAANLELPPGTGDAGWLRAIHAVVPALIRAFKPQIMVTQQGCDSHYSDPLAHLAISIDAQRTAFETLHDLAHEVCDGKWVALGGGGYELVDVVPRSWSHLTAIAAHRPVPLETDVPQEWRDHVQQRLGRPGPPRMGDGVAEGDHVWFRSWATGSDPDNPVDRAVMATRDAVFPHHGLDVWFD